MFLWCARSCSLCSDTAPKGWCVFLLLMRKERLGSNTITKYREKADSVATRPSLIKFLLKKNPFYVGDLRRARQFLSITR